MKNRTGKDFSEHVHTVEIYKCGEKEIRVDHFKKPETFMESLQFINTDRVLTITGDYGNWVFCRPFIPSPAGKVSDQYWIEKLKISSEQKLDELDLEGIRTEIKERIATGLEEQGFEGEELEKCKDWYLELLEETDDKLNYLAKAYRDYDRPDCIDHEDIPNYNKVPVWLEIIFDAFEVMCSRMEKPEPVAQS